MGMQSHLLSMCVLTRDEAPIKLLLQIADEYTQAFEHLLDAYHQIAQHLPRCDRLGKAFYDREDFQTVLAEIYSDILEFHSHAYAYLRRNGRPVCHLLHFKQLC